MTAPTYRMTIKGTAQIRAKIVKTSILISEQGSFSNPTTDPSDLCLIIAKIDSIFEAVHGGFMLSCCGIVEPSSEHVMES